MEHRFLYEIVISRERGKKLHYPDISLSYIAGCVWILYFFVCQTLQIEPGVHSCMHVCVCIHILVYSCRAGKVLKGGDVQ